MRLREHQGSRKDWVRDCWRTIAWMKSKTNFCCLCDVYVHDCDGDVESGDWPSGTSVQRISREPATKASFSLSLKSRS